MNTKNFFGLGTFRLFLALCVAFSHLWENMLPGPAAFSVWGFFVLSGFLMTLILTKKYGTNSDGLKKYAFNRFLRIYPSYVIACIIGVIVLLYYSKKGLNTTILNPAFNMPNTMGQWVSNIFMVPFGAQNHLVPVAHALFVEVWAYMLMPFTARSKSAAWLGLILTFLLNCQIGFGSATFATRYSDFSTSIIGFFVGSLACHYFDQLKRFCMPKVSVVVWCLHAMSWWVYDPYPWTHGIYISLIISAWVVISLFPLKVHAVDKVMGDLSYLVYLLHTTLGMCVYLYFNSRSLIFCIVSCIVTIILSVILIYGFERPLQKKFKIKTSMQKNS